MKFEDGQKWRTRGGDVVTLRAAGKSPGSFESFNERSGEVWFYANNSAGEAGEMQRQTFTYPSTEDLMELVSG